MGLLKLFNFVDGVSISIDYWSERSGYVSGANDALAS
jgi:hypothetical protein